MNATRSLPLKPGVILAGFLISESAATVVDFTRTIDGKYFRGGVQIGTYRADITYNSNPVDVRPYPLPGSAMDFPQYAVGYSPWPLYQDKFSITMSYAFGSDAPAGFENRSFADAPFGITDFIVHNDFEFNFSHPQDQLLILGERVDGADTSRISFRFRTESGSLGSTSLVDILEGNSEGIFACDAFSSCSYFGGPIGFPGGSLGLGSVDDVSPPVPVPEPGTMVLFSLGSIAACAAGRRLRSRAGATREG